MCLRRSVRQYIQREAHVIMHDIMSHVERDFAGYLPEILYAGTSSNDQGGTHMMDLEIVCFLKTTKDNPLSKQLRELMKQDSELQIYKVLDTNLHFRAVVKDIPVDRKDAILNRINDLLCTAKGKKKRYVKEAKEGTMNPQPQPQPHTGMPEVVIGRPVESPDTASSSWELHFPLAPHVQQKHEHLAFLIAELDKVNMQLSECEHCRTRRCFKELLERTMHEVVQTVDEH